MQTKVKEYRTTIPLTDQKIEVIFRIPQEKSQQQSTWEGLVGWGKKFAKAKKIIPKAVEKAISKRRYA